MLNTLIVGASGYAGAELALYLNRHPHMNITALAVSAQSADAGKLLSELHPQLKGLVDLPASVAMVTDAPAKMAKLADRGRLEVGLRADLVQVRSFRAIPVVRQVWREGQRIS